MSVPEKHKKGARELVSEAGHEVVSTLLKKEIPGF
jgi:hypothetical protein